MSPDTTAESSSERLRAGGSRKRRSAPLLATAVAFLVRQFTELWQEGRVHEAGGARRSQAAAREAVDSVGGASFHGQARRGHGEARRGLLRTVRPESRRTARRRSGASESSAALSVSDRFKRLDQLRRPDGHRNAGNSEQLPAARAEPERFVDVVELILDKGLVVDAYIRISVIGIELITIDARIAITSVDTYLRFAEPVNRLDLTQTEEDGLKELRDGGGEATAAGAPRRRGFTRAPRRRSPAGMRSLEERV